MVSIPESLLEQVERGNVLLFIGDRITRDAGGQIFIDQLATHLVNRCTVNDPDDYTFPEAAQAFADERGRHALVQFVRDHLETLGDEPQPVHRLIASLTACKILVTTCIDRRLERAFEEAGRPLNVIIGNVDVAFEDERKCQLYKLRGSLERVESLVLTEADYESFFEDQESISVVLQGYLARKTVLFAGYDLGDFHFKQLFRKVTAPLDDYARRAFAFGAVPTRRIARWCQRQDIEVIEVQTTAFLEQLTQQLTARTQPSPVVPLRSVEPPDILVPERPYKLLDYYEAKDAAIFFGRERETQNLASLIHAHRLVLLYGASGTGKTSLLLAGVSPRLEQAEPPYEILYVRALDDPAQVIRRAVQRRVPEVELLKDAPLVSLLGQAADCLERTVVIFLDQFEEFFIRRGSPARQAFISELGELYDAQDVPVKIVFSLREDWLASMSEIEARIPEVGRTKMRLLPLSAAQAQRTIIAPAEQLGVRYDPAVVTTLLADLEAESVSKEEQNIMPPQLQLVCVSLYERANSEDRHLITMADYEAVGRAQGILTRYIEGSLQEYPGNERAVAEGILAALVSSRATKALASLESIVSEIQADEATVKGVLSRLIRQRLVRRVDESHIYELAHDILAALISHWISEEDRRLKQVRELLRRELADWQQDNRIMLSRSKFQRINEVRSSVQPTAEESAFLLRAAITYDTEVSHWLEQIGGLNDRVDILLEMLEIEASQARRTAAKYLAQFPRNEVATALAHTALTDSESSVRDAAAISLGRMVDGTGIKALIETVEAGDHLQQTRTLHALALIRDIRPDGLAEMDKSVQRQVFHELAKIRFWRYWPRIQRITAAGAVGGGIAFGIGLSIPLTLHQIALSGDIVQPIVDFIFIGAILVAFGLLAGAGIAFFVSTAEAIFSERARLQKILVSTLLGGVSTAAVLSPLDIVDRAGVADALLAVLGSGILGMLMTLGISLPRAFNWHRLAVLGGGTAGAAVGVIIWGMLGYNPFQIAPPRTVPLPVLLIFGGFAGLIMAVSLTWAETRWPAEEADKQREYLPFKLDPVAGSPPK